MIRFFQLFFSFFKVGALNELQYRANFFVQIFQSLLALGVGLFGLALVFNQTATLAGWSASELLAVMGVFFMMGGMIRVSIQPNMERLMGDIRQGTLDYALTKPADSQVLVSIREVRIWQSVDILMGAIVLGYAVLQVRSQVGLIDALAFTAALLMGGLMVYCFWLVITTGAFWVIRIDQIVELFQGVYQAGRWPVTIYPGWLRILLTFLVPVAFAVTVPAESLTGRLTGGTLLLAFLLTILLMVITRLVWKFGLRFYSGASA